MKKVSVYFTDGQAETLEAMAAQAGITFAEALRRVLDEWLALRERGSMSDEATSTGMSRQSCAYIKLYDDNDATLIWRNAEIDEDRDNGRIDVWRGDVRIASFEAREVASWYTDNPNEE
jgi:hypothetical protein